MTLEEDGLTEDKLKKMCDSCIHKIYCIGAFRKDHWCGNHASGKEHMKDGKFYRDGGKK